VLLWAIAGDVVLTIFYGFAWAPLSGAERMSREFGEVVVGLATQRWLVVVGEARGQRAAHEEERVLRGSRPRTRRWHDEQVERAAAQLATARDRLKQADERLAAAPARDTETLIWSAACQPGRG